MHETNIDRKRFDRRIAEITTAARHDLEFAFLGSGFVTTSSGRVFFPLIGRAKLVPSAQEEVRFGAAWPKWWQAIGVALICLVASGTTVNGASLSLWLSLVLFPMMLIAVVVVWCWRERALTRLWERTDDPSSDRTSLVVAKLSAWPRLQLFAALVCLALFAGYHVYGLIAGFGTLELTPGQDLITPEWLRRGSALLLLVGVNFVLIRACYWGMVALLRRRPHTAS